MPDATFVCPDLKSFCRLDELGLLVVGQRLDADRAVLACRVVEGEFDGWCRRCGGEGAARDTVTRELAHEPFGWRPTTLLVTIRRLGCVSCRHVWRQDTSRAAEPRAKLSRRALRWALEAIVCQHLTVARVAEALAVTWNTANDAVLAEGKRVLINDADRLDGVRVIGVDEHVWRHTRRGDKYVTVIIDLTPVRDGAGSARLLDMVEGRSKQVFTGWLQAQTSRFRNGIEVVAMDGFTGFKTAAAETLPDAAAVMDPFYDDAPSTWWRWPGTPWTTAADACSRKPAVIVAAPGTRSTGSAASCAPGSSCSPTDSTPAHRRVRRRGPRAGRGHLGHLPAHRRRLPRPRPPRRQGHPAEGHRRPQHRCAKRTDRADHPRANPAPQSRDVLAYFDRPGTSNGPTEAINGRLEHLRGTALGFRNLTNCILRSLLDLGGFRPRLHPLLR